MISRGNLNVPIDHTNCFESWISTMQIFATSLWIDEDETQMTSFQDCPYLNCHLRGVSMPWPDLLFFHLWFSAKYCNQESLVGTETSAIVHSLFTLGDGWASDSVSETQPSMLFLELIPNASRITNLLYMFWI